MARGTVRGALTGALVLIALQKITTARGAASVSGGMDVLNSLVERALSPDVAAVPNFAHATGRQEEPEPAPIPDGPRNVGSVPDPSTIPVPKIPE